MSIFERLSRKPVERSITRTAVPGRAGNMTALQAWEVVAPIALELDPQAKLTFVTSGLDMNDLGRSRIWEFIFVLPKHRANAMLSLEPETGSEDVDSAPCILTKRIHPSSALDGQKPGLPDGFRDSPEVVAEFSGKGVDFVAGPTDMKLEGRVLASGEAVWVTYYWDREYTTPFGVAKCGFDTAGPGQV